MREATHHPRRRRVVDPILQRRIVRDVVKVPIATLIVSVLGVALLARELRTEAALAEIALPSLVPCLIAMAGVVAIAAFALFAQAITVSNLVAGPQFNIRSTVARALETQSDEALAERVTLREDDYLADVANDVNTLLARIEVLTRQRDARPEPELAQRAIDTRSAMVVRGPDA